MKDFLMFAKIITISLLSFSLVAESIPSNCTALLNKNVDHVCYIGSIDLNLKQQEQLSLYYDGSIIKVNNGFYCFKEHKSIKKLYFLFINPEAICFRTDRNETTSYLTFNNDTPHEFYRIKQKEAVNLENETFVDWSIKQKPMKKQKRNLEFRVVIPEHTIIVPLNANFFDHSHEKITFNYKPLKAKHAIIKLPTPQYNQAVNRDKLVEALLHANLCIMNLKNIHTPQEIKKISLDNHTLMQEAQ